MCEVDGDGREEKFHMWNFEKLDDCYILTLNQAVNQEMHLCKYAEEQQKQVDVKQ